MQRVVSLAEAQLIGQLHIADGARVDPGVWFVIAEDDDRCFGTITIGSGAIVRTGAIICSGVAIGSSAVIGHHAVLRRSATIGNGSVISHQANIEQRARIGANVRISGLTHITGGAIVEDNVQIGAGVATINDGEMAWPHHKDLVPPIFRNGCKIGSGATIMSGVEIGQRTIVGAGSVVTRSLPENVVAYGNPAYVQSRIVSE